MTDYPPLLRAQAEKLPEGYDQLTLRYAAEHIETLEKALRAIAELPAAEAPKSRTLARKALCLDL